jgi:hypothetical protein
MFAAGLAVVAGSFRFDPDPSADQSFIARARHADAPGLKVSVAALGPEESRRSFGAPLARYGIQPIWLAIEMVRTRSFRICQSPRTQLLLAI